MKKLLSTIALTAALSFNVSASNEEEGNMCDGYSKLAGTIMEMRQENTAMSEMYNVLKGNDVSIALLKEAYKVPLYSVDSNKLKAVNEFKNTAFMACIEATSI